MMLMIFQRLIHFNWIQLASTCAVKICRVEPCLSSMLSLFYAFLQFCESSNRIIGTFLKTAKVNVRTFPLVFLKILAYQ